MDEKLGFVMLFIAVILAVGFAVFYQIVRKTSWHRGVVVWLICALGGFLGGVIAGAFDHSLFGLASFVVWAISACALVGGAMGALVGARIGARIAARKEASND